MQRLNRDSMTRDSTFRDTAREGLTVVSSSYMQILCILMLVSAASLSGCGGGSSSTTQGSAALSGNWQISMTATPDLTANSGLQGGFLLQTKGAVTGSLVYSNSLLNSLQGPCNSGSAPITGTLSGETVTLTAAAGPQTFSLTGTLSSDGSMITGTYTATPGTAADGSACGSGTAQSGPMAWSAKSVPPLTGAITGNFHGGTGYNSGLDNQDFPVTGALTQGENIGASNATITGYLSFINPATLVSDYPCIPSGYVNVNGVITGNTVVLQLIGNDGSNDGQIGTAASQLNNVAGAQPVTLDSTTNGYVLHSTGIGYGVSSKSCPNTSTSSGDGGYVCLALNSATTCQQPVSLSPSALTFPLQLLGSTNPSTQTLTLTNNQPSGSTPLSGLTLTWVTALGSNSDIGQTDFTNLPDFTESDNCAAPAGSTFSLNPGQSCTITVSFAPQESCTWLPNQGGTPPARCPTPLTATVTVNDVPSVDNDQNSSAVPISGTGASFVQPSTRELDFGAEAFGEASLPQLLYFTNHGSTPVQILPKATCVNSFSLQSHQLPYPLIQSSPVAGLQVVSNLNQDTSNFTVDYSCDYDPNTLLPNVQITADTMQRDVARASGRMQLTSDFCAAVCDHLRWRTELLPGT